VLYGSETWTLKKEDIKRLEACVSKGKEMWIWRRMEKVSWIEHKTNEEVLETIGEERSLMRRIKTRQKKCIEHTLRRESLLKMVIKGKMLGKRSRGRPKQMMLDWMMVEGYKKLKEEAVKKVKITYSCIGCIATFWELSITGLVKSYNSVIYEIIYLASSLSL